MNDFIYVLFSCDEWKSHSSMSLVTATVSPETLIDVIKTEILKKNMNYTRGKDNLSREEQTALFERDFEEEGLDFAINNLEYGYVESVEDGEVL